VGVATTLYLGVEISRVQNMFTFSPFSFSNFCKIVGRAHSRRAHSRRAHSRRAHSRSCAVLNLRYCLCFCHTVVAHLWLPYVQFWQYGQLPCVMTVFWQFLRSLC